MAELLLLEYRPGPQDPQKPQVWHYKPTHGERRAYLSVIEWPPEGAGEEIKPIKKRIEQTYCVNCGWIDDEAIHDVDSCPICEIEWNDREPERELNFELNEDESEREEAA